MTTRAVSARMACRRGVTVLLVSGDVENEQLVALVVTDTDHVRRVEVRRNMVQHAPELADDISDRAGALERHLYVLRLANRPILRRRLNEEHVELSRRAHGHASPIRAPRDGRHAAEATG